MEPRRDILGAVARADAGDERAALATVVRVRGSTPRSAGASMIVRDDGATLGTIGGGCGEADVLEAARRVLATGIPALVRVELLDAVDSLSPAVCGGTMEVLVEPVWAPGPEAP